MLRKSVPLAAKVSQNQGLSTEKATETDDFEIKERRKRIFEIRKPISRGVGRCVCCSWSS